MINSQLTNQQMYIQSKDNVIHSNEQKQMVVNMDNGTCYDLGEIGQVIWEVLSMAATIDQIVTILTTEFEVTNEECRSIVEQFITELLATGLIETDQESR
ncbi:MULTISPECIES: PqqD family peptide modification chaperone [Paraliobacillus]|uniref:PqqD family peptide modification chaperone n=1 Tax=Paraliobacillus TaxID=200903 RepID=UPI000DD3D817|nr:MULTISPECIES: PqqD family peptide modification chaperone [Paraliobacillus]